MSLLCFFTSFIEISQFFCMTLFSSLHHPISQSIHNPILIAYFPYTTYCLKQIWDLLSLLPEWTRPGSGLRDTIPPGIDHIDERGTCVRTYLRGRYTDSLKLKKWLSSRRASYSNPFNSLLCSLLLSSPIFFSSLSLILFRSCCDGH